MPIANAMRAILLKPLKHLSSRQRDQPEMKVFLQRFALISRYDASPSSTDGNADRYLQHMLLRYGMAGSMLPMSESSCTREVVVYDGSCGFCTGQMARIRRWDRDDRFEYAAWQSSDVAGRFPQLAQAELSSGMRLVQTDGRVLVGADAVHGIFRQLPGWRWVAWLYRVPGICQVCRWVYRRIAANRYRWGGKCSAGDAAGKCEVAGKEAGAGSK